MMLAMCRPDLPALNEVAAQFNTSKRSFQLALSNYGVSFRRISDDIKRDLAKCLRKSNTLKTQDIAYLLGYSDASAYLHAERKWRVNL